MNVAFYIAGLIAVVSTVLVITGRNAVHSLLYLIVSLLAVALAFFLLGAPFVAALEVVVYAGAIMVLFIFVIMMLNQGQASLEQEETWTSRRVWLGPVLLTLVLAVEVLMVLKAGGVDPARDRVVNAKELSQSLFGPYFLVIELASMLLLVGLIGAYHLIRRGPGRREIGDR